MYSYKAYLDWQRLYWLGRIDEVKAPRPPCVQPPPDANTLAEQHPAAFDYAVRNGDVEMAQWFLQNYPDEITAYAYQWCSLATPEPIRSMLLWKFDSVKARQPFVKRMSQS